jgi:PEP-CTERM motif-containing protein
MTISVKQLITLCSLLALLFLASAAPVRADLSASAQITDTQIGPGEFQYDITLSDTGTTNVGTLWFSWVPGQDFMPVSPTGVLAPTDWSEKITNGGSADGFAIQFIAGAGDALTAGNSLSGFQFDSSMTPAQLEGLSSFHPASPVLTAFAYIGAPFGDPGEKFTASVVPTSTPEPATLLLTALGIGMLALLRRPLLT